ncbi:hypothetical protein V1478_009664 [Vespula squamosa]|uniref:Uncharacterized protein n=1 Tax=Vespula squamosa TaxID=30214 RepID=A0ABD2AQA6_VESSQ
MGREMRRVSLEEGACAGWPVDNIATARGQKNYLVGRWKGLQMDDRKWWTSPIRVRVGGQVAGGVALRHERRRRARVNKEQKNPTEIYLQRGIFLKGARPCSVNE